MPILRSLAARARILRRRDEVEDELAEELQDHLEREVERQRANGIPEAEARRRAIWRVGSIEAIKEEVRDERGGRWLLDAFGDLRVGGRSLRRSPGFTLAVVLSLALGVAGVTAIASVLNAVVIQPLPYPDSGRLHLVRVAWNAFSAPLSAADFLRLREASDGIAGTAAYRFGAEGYTLLGLGEPLVVAGAAVSPETPRVLGVPPAIGRWFTEHDEAREALISDALWRRRFGASQAAVGRTLVLDRGVYTIVGVMPPGFDVPGQSRAEVWLSAALDEPTRRGPYFLWVALRLRPGMTAQQAAAQLTTAVTPVLEERYGAEPAWRYVVTPMKDVVVGDTRLTLWLFLAAAGLVLAIASVNVANLMLARGASRMREMAVRASLGAGRARLVRQLLAESALLGCGSAIIGLAAAAGLLALIVRAAGDLIPRSTEIDIDLVTAALAACLGVGTALVTGAAPALWLTGRRLAAATRTGGRTATSGPGEGRIRRAMVIAEVALALCVLVATVLLVKTMTRLDAEAPGFDPRGVLSFRLVAPPDPYDEVTKLNAYFESIDRSLRRLPGVTGVAFAESLPPDRLQQSNNYTLQGEEPGTPGRTAQGSGVAQWNMVSPQFFEVLGVPTLQGRTFTEMDLAQAPAVAIVSRTFAEKHFSDGNAVGRRLKGGDWDPVAPWLTIVGVVGDMPYDRGVWSGTSPTVYLPQAQNAGSRWQFVVLRTDMESAAAAGLASAVRAADSRVPLRDVAPMVERLAASAAVPRFRMRLFAVLGVVAVTLAIIGLYGVLAYQVTRRRKETAVRRALGARSAGIVTGIVGSGLALTATGILIGMAAAFGLTRSLSAILFGVAADDPSAFAAAAAVLIGAATAASVMPALRAISDDPVAVLRED